MAKSKIDRDKLRIQLLRLREDDLLELLSRAVELMPATRLPALLDGYLSPEDLAPDAKGAGSLLETVRAFHETSHRGVYYDSFNVNSKNFMKTSPGTATWLAECERLFVRCADAARAGQHASARPAFELLFGLLRHIDKGSDDVVFFADEGGSWQVGVRWETVLPAYFSALSATAEPKEYALAVVGVVDDFVRYDRDRYLNEARTLGTEAQREELSSKKAPSR